MSRESVPTNGAAIRRARMVAGYGGAQFAAVIGISASYLSLLENGRKNASPGMLSRIAKGVGVKVATLMDAAFVNGTQETD